MGINKVVYDGNTLIDLTEDKVTEETLADGVTAHNANGERITGRAVLGGEAVSGIFWVTGVMNLGAMSISNMSHTYDELVTAINDGKLIKFKCAYVLSPTQTVPYYAYGDVVAHLQNALNGQIMVQADLGAGMQLYYFNVTYTYNNITVTPYTVNTTAIGG